MRVKFSSKLPDSIGWWLAKDDDEIFTVKIYKLYKSYGILVSDELDKNLNSVPISEHNHLKWAGPIEFKQDIKATVDKLETV